MHICDKYICLPDGVISAFHVHYYSMGMTQFTCGRSGITLEIDPSSLGAAGTQDNKLK